ncbi:hypothetical protein ACTQ1O_01885 [Bilifractor sp. LCP21S3_A7]|uniref:hypothetical protein n=1 Tax=Bilifractor sp. LCP21S3_A7 TaxID=3438738 RepID=UPI003F939F34
MGNDKEFEAGSMRGNPLGTDISAEEVRDLAEKFIYSRYIVGKEQNQKFLHNLKMPEYLALHIVREYVKDLPEDNRKMYLNVLSEKLELPINETSHVAEALKNRGYVTWTFDGKGNGGTYLNITQRGLDMLADNEKRVDKFTKKVVNRFGLDRMLQFMEMSSELSRIMKDEREETESGESSGKA